MIDRKSVTRITLDAMLAFAEVYQTASNDFERTKTDSAAYEFLSYCGYDLKTMYRFGENYKFLREYLRIGDGR